MGTFFRFGAPSLLAVILLVSPGITTASDSVGAGLNAADLREGRRLFEKETFGGNGRTCQTCHSPANGTLTLRQIEKRYALDPDDPLFRGDGSDDGAGNGVSRILAEGTIRVTLEGGAVSYVSRRYVRKIKEALGL